MATTHRTAAQGSHSGRVRRLVAGLETVARPRAVMIGWGVICGLAGGLALLVMAPHLWPIEATRFAQLRDSLAIINHGGPLLLGRHPNGQLYAVGVTDDQGVFVYIPWLSHVLGIRDPLTTLRDSYVVLFGLSAASYPLIFWRLTRSVLGGLVAPIILLVCVRSMGFNDLYWIVPWGVLALLPIVFLLAEVNIRPSALVVTSVAVALVGGWVSSLRSQAGLGVVIALAIVLVLRRWRWWRTIPLLAVIAVSYLATSAWITAAVRSHRDARLHTTALSRNQPAGHPLWHTAYIGLGYLPNPEHIRYQDSVAAARVARDAPGTRYLSPRYATVLRRAYFSFVSHHPGEFVKQYSAKVLVTVADCGPYLILAALTLPWMLLFGPGRRRRRLWCLLTIPALVLTFLPMLVAIPLQVYEQGLYGTLGLISVIGFTWCAERFAEAAGQPARLRSQFDALRRGPTGASYGRSLRVTGAIVAVLIPIMIGAHFVRRDAERWLGMSSGVIID